MIAGRSELVIFDCDGVLVDSEPIINRAHAQVLAACGYQIAEEDLVERFCGMSDAEMLGIIEREWGRALPPSYAEHVETIIEDGFGQSLMAIAGVAEALDALTVPVCVASSSVPEPVSWRVLARICSARRWSRAASQRLICSSTRHNGSLQSRIVAS